MSTRHYLSTTLLALALLIGGCTSLPEQPKETISSFVDRQISLARSQENNQELATALSHWQVVLLLDPSHSEALQQQRKLQKILDNQADTAYQSGLRALRSGNRTKAKAKFLDTLAAKPSHTEARQKLSKIQTSRMLNSQKKKSTLEQSIKNKQSMIEPGPDQQYLTRSERVNSPKSEGSLETLQKLFDTKQYQLLIKRAKTIRDSQDQSTINQLLGQAYLATCQEHLSKNQMEQASKNFSEAKTLLIDDQALEPLSKEMATAYHQNGRRLLPTDIDKGIVYLQESLKYDPANSHVQSLLKHSQLLKKRLSKISSGG